MASERRYECPRAVLVIACHDKTAVEPGSRFRIAVSDQNLVAEAPATGGYGIFRKVTLGRLVLAKAGEYELAIRPEAGEPRFGREADSGGGRAPGAWKAINLRSLTLRPVPE
jgi:hypothetical protein